MRQGTTKVTKGQAGRDSNFTQRARGSDNSLTEIETTETKIMNFVLQKLKLKRKLFSKRKRNKNQN